MPTKLSFYDILHVMKVKQKFTLVLFVKTVLHRMIFSEKGVCYGFHDNISINFIVKQGNLICIFKYLFYLLWRMWSYCLSILTLNLCNLLAQRQMFMPACLVLGCVKFLPCPHPPYEFPYPRQQQACNLCF